VDVREAMYAASDNSPPSRVDLDKIIKGEQRRRQWLGGGVIAGGTVAAVLAVTLSVTLVARLGDELSEPGALAPAGEADSAACAVRSAEPSSDHLEREPVSGPPSEPVAVAIPRLTDALRATLSQVVPAGMDVIDERHPDCPGRFDTRRWSVGYGAEVTLRDAAGTSALSVALLAVLRGQDQYPCPNTDSTDPAACNHETLPDGTAVTADTYADGPATIHEVTVRRPDGTYVAVTLTNELPAGIEDTETPPAGSPVLPSTSAPVASVEITRPEPSLTLQQVRTIGLTTGLTLYPHDPEEN
jgi:hypothetical protein